MLRVSEITHSTIQNNHNTATLHQPAFAHTRNVFKWASEGKSQHHPFPLWIDRDLHSFKWSYEASSVCESGATKFGELGHFHRYQGYMARTGQRPRQGIVQRLVWADQAMLDDLLGQVSACEADQQALGHVFSAEGCRWLVS
jgi:hypothetical protein